MNTFLISIDATTTINGSTPPTLEVLVGGVVVSSAVMSAGANTYNLFVEYSGAVPSSVSLRFNAGTGDPTDNITFTAVSINDDPLNLGTDLTATMLSQGNSSTVSASAETYGHTVPTLGAPTIIGTAGDDDNISGGNAADVIDGLAGNDRIRGRDNDDAINGGAGDDYIFGESGADTILGGAGNDILFGNGDDDIIFGEGDNDYLIGGAGDDVLNGGAGMDGLIGDDGDDVMFGEDGDDWLTGDDGDDVMFGDNGNDIVIGGAGNDAVSGGDGDDYLVGDSGNDLLSGGDGDDEIVAGIGNDVVSAGDGDDDVYGGDGTDEIAGGDDDDYLSGGDGADTLDGDAGIDVLNGGAGADTINGGTGNDFLHGHGLDADTVSDILFNNPGVTYNQDTGSFYQFVISGANATTAATLAAGTTLNGVAGHLGVITTQTELTYLDGIAAGGSYWLSGGDTASEGAWVWADGEEAGAQYWQGGVGGATRNNFSDLWAAGQPNDSDGTQDYAYLWSASDGMADAGLTGFTHSVGYIVEWEGGLFSDDNAADILSGGSGDDWIYGYGGGDTLNGDAGDDLLFGGNGNDTLSGGSDDDFLSGGSGTDTVDYSNSASGVTVDLAAGTATGEGSDTFLSIENVTGSSSDDDLTGDSGNNVLDGGDGDDILNGGTGNDTLTAGEGADTLRGGDQVEVVVTGATMLSYGGGQDVGGAVNYMDDGVGVELDGNLWKRFLVNYTVTSNTVIEFDFRSTNEAEISGIGFDNDNSISSNLTFKVYGTQNWGRTNYDNYDGSGNWTHYTIDVGNFYTGTYSHLFIVNDDDGGGDDGEGYFRNIVIHEDTGETNTLTSGEGVDNLYGDAGVDTFVFEDTGDEDVIHFFNEGDGDILDVSNILVGFVAGTSDIDDFLQLTTSGDHQTLSVDVNGTTGGASFVDIAEMRGMSDLDISTLYTNSQIVV